MAAPLVIDVTRAAQLARLPATGSMPRWPSACWLAAQASREAQLAIADDVIVNDGTLDALDAAIGVLDLRYRELAGAR